MNRVPQSQKRLAAAPAAIDLAPLLVAGWGVALPGGDLDLVSRILLVAAFVALVRLVAHEFPPSQLLKKRIIILGSGPMASKLIAEIDSSERCHYEVAGVVDDAPPVAGWTENIPWLGASANMPEIVEKIHPALIVMAVDDRRQRLPLLPLLESRVRGVIVEDALDFYERITGKMAIEALTPSMLILSRGFRNSGASEITARVVSVLAAGIGLLFCAPLLAILAIAVKLESRGPVLFVQARAGRNGLPFGLLKFRTMHPCETNRSEWVRDNAHRITRLGKWLRRFRLDELPQLVNVLRGEMNIVGPRPHPVCNHTVFMEQIAYYRLRSTVRPGVTGWAQCRYGYANDLEEETEKMRYDLYYIKNRSLWLDIRILFETVAIMLFGQGASEVRRPTPVRSEPWRRRSEGAAYARWIMGPDAARHAGRQ